MKTKMVDFQAVVWAYYDAHSRHDLLWRQLTPAGGLDPYAVMVSEVMLQQTQVSRVTPKFAAFMERFPTVETLAAAPLSAVLAMWSGLGYNRRAKFLWQAAQTVVADYGGDMPRTPAELVKLPGVGKNTAGAIATYAYDQPFVFIETNVRTVFIHHFFADDAVVADKELEPLIQTAVDSIEANRSPRHWYWALMDYGTHLKQVAGNASRRSASYAKQSAFEGSRRQIRGRVLQLLRQPMDAAELAVYISDDRLPEVLTDLVHEQLISHEENVYSLGSA